MFESFVDRIRAKDSALNHPHKWTFLYTPKKTFRQNQPLMFVGLNPGGREDYVGYKECPSCEDGNDYLIGKWEDHHEQGGQSPLQIQIQALYKDISSKLDGMNQSHKELMNKTLALNFIPFRSQSWRSLQNKEEILQFSQELMTDIINFVNPAAIITMDRNVYHYISKIYHSKFIVDGAYTIESKSDLVEWGRARYTIDRYTHPKDKTRVIVRLPHLSRYKIYSRDQCEKARRDVSSTVAQCMKG